METPLLSGLPIKSETIANWRYTPEEWRRFGEYEGRHFHKLIRQSKKVLVVFAVLTIIALLCIPVFGLIGIVPWNSEMILAAILILIVGGGLMGITIVVWLMQRSKLATLMADSGEVIITLSGINTNGIWNYWNYDSSLGRRFHDARTMTLKKGKPDEMDILEVRTIATTVSGTTNREVISSCRVPIPSGRRREAEDVLGKILHESSKRKFL